MKMIVTIVEENKHAAKEAYQVCQQKVVEHNLDMKLVDVEYTFIAIRLFSTLLRMVGLISVN